MADPFEVRLRFTNLLSHLSASATASIKTAHYALKHRDMDEDLHSCILENLERNNMNNRANIMYFLEHFCDMSIKEGHHEYVDMVRRDIERIVEAVAPRGGAGGANVKVVRRVVQELGSKGVLAEDIVLGIEEGLKGREGERGELLGDLPGGDGESDDAFGNNNNNNNNNRQGAAGATDDGIVMGDAPVLAPDKETETASQQKQSSKTDGDSQRVTPRTSGTGAGVVSGNKPNGVLRVDKRVIEQRIEEDRERNKRLRESVWAVTGDDAEELDKMWEEGSDVDDDDYMLASEEADERKQAAKYSLGSSSS